MATKKYTYISPDSFKETTRDTFRKLMGQYWYSTTDPDGFPVLVYGEPVGGEDGAPERYRLSDVDTSGDGFSDATVVTINPQEVFGASAYEDTRYITITKVGSASDVGEYGVEDVAPLEDGRKIITLNVTGADEHYQTLTKFTDDMRQLFSNPIVDGVEDYFHEESLQYEIVDDNVEAKAEYNYFVEEYENLSKTVQETVLPNFYAVSLIEYDTDPLGEDADSFGLYNEVAEHSLLYGNSLLLEKIEENGVDPDDLVTSVNEFDYSLNVPYKEYFKEWSSAYTDLDFAQTSGLITQGKNIIQTYSSYDSGLDNGSGATIGQLNDRSLKMPFSIRLALPPEGKNIISTSISYPTVADTLGVQNLTTVWVSHIISSLDSSLLVDPAYETEYEFISKQYRTDGGEIRSLNASPILKVVDGTGRNYSSVSRLLQESEDARSGELDGVYSEGSFAISEKLILDTDKSLENIRAHELDEDFESNIGSLASSLLLHNELTHEGISSFDRTLLGFDGRLYNGIFQDGETSEGQTIAYRVKKHRGDSTTNVPVQDIWIPNANDIGNPMEYVDTQVRYGEQYTYDIYAYKYVFGTRYRYKEIQAPSLDLVEILIDGAEQLIGYNFSWFGAKNLFDILPASGLYAWQQAAIDMNSFGVGGVSQEIVGPPSGDYYYDTFRIFNYYIDPSSYPIPGTRDGYPADDHATWPAWTPKATRFFSINEIRTIMSQAWVIKPTGLTEAGVNIDYPSWQELWGLDWPSATGDWINEETLMDGGTYNSDEIDDFLRGMKPASDFDPAQFTLENWFQLFMGHDTSSHGATTYTRVQRTPPSHHLLNGKFLGYDAPGPLRDREDPLAGDQGRFTGLEGEGDGLVARTSAPPPGASPFAASGAGAAVAGAPSAAAAEIGFHGSDLGISDVFAGDGIPLVEVHGYKAQYQIEMLPCTRIVEVPYTTITTSVLSKPPPPPEVEIIPYRAVNNELLFTFDATIAEMRMVGVPITQKDELLFEKHYQAQAPLDGKLTFKSDDIPAFFEIFRLDRPPNSYADFDGNKRATISTLIDDEKKIIRSRSTDYIDKLQPNVKYYYTFRTVDFHDNVSNPTFIYEVELVDDGGAIYPLINLYQLPIIDSKVSSKTMKKMIQVYPALEQVTANLPANTGVDDPSDIAIGDVVLGNINDPIWGKTFKIRLTSRKTGKKIDMNVTFDKRDDRTTS